MKKILQILRSGETKLVELPSPSNAKQMLGIQTTHSLISVGIKCMLVKFWV